MATQKKYVSLEKLTKYDELLKAKIKADDQATLDSAKKYTDDSVALLDPAGSAATAEANAKSYTDQLANGQVKTNTNAIATLNGDASTDGSVAKAIADAKVLIDADVDAVEAVANQNAADIETLEGKVEALEAGTYDDTEVRGLISANADAIGALEQTHATDKDALEDAIALKADQTALDEVSAVANAAATQTALQAEIKRAGDEEARIEGLVTAEAERAVNAEAGLEGRIEKMEVFWDTTEDADGVVNKLKEIQDYIAGDETGAAEMAGNIQANTQAIASMDAAYKAADVTLQNNIDKKADASAVESLDGRVEELETASATHATKTEVQAVSDALTEYKNAHTGDYTNSQIEGKITEAIDGEVTRVDAELAKKVDKVEGKGLSTNDLTNELKVNYDAAYTHSQAAHAPANAQANIIESVKVNGTALTITGKAVDISVPTDNAELTNGAGYLVANDIVNKADKATTLAGYGITDAYTTAQTDTAITNAMNQFVECSETEITALFQ